MDNPILHIVEKVRTFTLDSLVEHAINRVKLIPAIEQPWVMLAYLEIVYRECDNNKLKFKATYSDFNSIFQQLFELMDKHPFANFAEYPPNKIFHVLAYQQFPYQIFDDENAILRQRVLFNSENSNSRLNEKLKNDYGLTVHQFLNLWENIKSKSSDEKFNDVAEILFHSWTIKHEHVKKEIQIFSNGIGNDFYKTFVPEFFLKYPIIDVYGNRFFVDTRLLRRSINEFLFNRVIEYSEVKGIFDSRFQEYVDKSLSDIGIDYKSDIDLKCDGENECDFMIQEFVFAECKAIRLRPLAQANPSDQILKNNLGDILKAYKQLISTANRNKCKREDYFGIIITYLPFYFSDGTDIWDILKSDVNEYLRQNDFDLLIEPTNLFFIDISSWDKLIEILDSKQTDCLRNILNKAKKSNLVNRKFEFSMHLKD